MLSGRKIALFGTGHIWRNSVSAPVLQPLNLDVDYSFLFDKKAVSLVDIYKKVKSKYHPESDVYKINKK